MNTWTSEELNKIGHAEELQIASLKGDGTLRKPVTIWVVRVGDELYVRSYRGSRGAWYRHAQEGHEGQIHSGGVTKDVAFVEATDPTINHQVDAAYRSKYGHHSAEYVDPMLAPAARATTMKLVPGGTRP